MPKNTASAAGGAMPVDPRLTAIRASIADTLGEMHALIDALDAPALPVEDKLLAVADMLEEIRALIDAGQHDDAEAKLNAAKAMLAVARGEGAAQ